MCSPHSLQLLDRTFGLRELLCIAGAQHHIRVEPVLWIEGRIAPDRDPRIGLGDLTSCIPMSPSRASARTVSENMRTPILSLGATSSSIACMIEGTPAITITLPGAPDILLRMRSAPLGMRVMRRRASFISAPVVFTHSCRMASARVSVSIGTPNAFRHAVGGDVTVGRPDPAGGEDIGAAMPQRIECVDDRALLIADHPHFLEIDADRRQIFRDMADVLVLGAARQDFAADHQERGRDDLFGSGRVGGRHDHLRRTHA